MAGSNPATYLYYDGWSLVQEGSSAANAGRLYVHGNRVDEIVASQTGGVWNYHHYDARGHCILLTGPSGNVIEQYEYDAFGKPYFYNAIGVALPYSSSYGNRFLFTGREWLRDLKLYDYRARMYQPELGRFLQPDPKQFEAGDYNLYRFCHNDPVNKSDPTGFVWVIPGKLREDFDTARAAAWNPRAAVAFAGGSQSPATVLIHEAAHADRIALDPQGSKNAFAAGDGPMGRAGVFGNMEDRRVILGPEAQAAKALGEDTRSSAAGVFYPVDSVLGR
jgi:RHS repeat-associated protein